MSTSRRIAGAGWATDEQARAGVCRYCGGPVAKPRRTFCSGRRAKFSYPEGDEIAIPGEGCVHEHCIRSNPGYARQCVFVRDRGACAVCGRVCGGLRGRWEMDHIVPVVEGGGACGLENLRTLCPDHHREATAALAKRRADRRRQASSDSSSPTIGIATQRQR